MIAIIRYAPVATLFLLTGCAQAPDAIAPVYISDVPYRAWSCDQLGTEQARLVDTLEPIAAQQTTAHNDDAIGVLLFGLPVGSMAGEGHEAHIARLQGELEAVQRALQTKICNGPGSPNQDEPAPSP